MLKYFLYYEFPDGTRLYTYLDGNELTYDQIITLLGSLIRTVQSAYWEQGVDCAVDKIHENIKASVPAYGIVHRALGRENCAG